MFGLLLDVNQYKGVNKEKNTKCMPVARIDRLCKNMYPMVYTKYIAYH